MGKAKTIKGAVKVAAPLSPEMPESGKVEITLNNKNYIVSVQLAKTLINKGSATLKTK